MKSDFKKLLTISSVALALCIAACNKVEKGSEVSNPDIPNSSLSTSSEPASSSSEATNSSSSSKQGYAYKGMGLPPADLGEDGDTYTDLATNDVYTKVNGTWIITSGDSEGYHYSGNGEPNNSLGDDGDTYTDILTDAVYEKQNGRWILIKQGTTTHIVKFNLDGGRLADGSTTIPDQVVKDGRWVNRPADPYKEHCTFIGWYAEGSSHEWDFLGGAVYGSFTLIARYNVNDNEKITVTINPNNGTAPYTHDTYVGDYYYPTIPSKEGYEFDGWYIASTQKKYNGYVDGSLANATIEAHWKKSAFNVKYKVEDGEATITGLLNIDSVTVTIPASINGIKVTKIGNTAFQSRISLEVVNLPATIKYIAPEAFIGARRMTEVNVDSANINYCSVKGIVFSKDMTELVYYPVKAGASYTVPNTVKKIGDYAFYGHMDMGISSIIFNAGLEVIGKNAFRGNELIKSLEFPKSLRRIEDCAFYGPANTSEDDSYVSPQGTITNVVFNDGLEYLGPMAFANQYFKETLKLPSTVKEIGEYCFGNCNAITKFIVPRDLEILGDNAFSAATGMLDIGVEEGNTHFKVHDKVLYSFDMKTLVMCPSGRTEPITIPEGVTALGDYAFYMVDELKEYNFPSTLKTIGKQCFAHTYNLRSFTIPDSVISMGIETFMESGIATISIGSGLTNIPEACFYNTKLGSVVIPSNIKSIGYEAFSYSKSLSQVFLGEGVEVIQRSAFGSCSRLTSVSMPNSLKRIEDAAFSGTQMTILEIKDGLEEISPVAFPYVSVGGYTQPALASISVSSGNTHFAVSNNMLLSKDGKKVYLATGGVGNANGELTVPEGVTEICDAAFAYNRSISSLNLPSSLVKIGDLAFYRGLMKSVAFGNNLKSIGESAFESSSLTNITFGTSIENIGPLAFRATDIKVAAFPNTLKVIDDFAFYQCALLSNVTFGTGLQKIGEAAFACANIANINEIPASVTFIGEGAFSSEVRRNGNIFNAFKVNASNANYSTDSTGALLMDKNQTVVIGLAGGATSATVPNTVKEIAPYGLANVNSSLLTLTLPEGLKTIGKNGLAYLPKLATVTIPASVSYVGERAFEDWGSNRSIIFNCSEQYALSTFHPEFKVSCNAAISYGAK